jgi:NADH-quinone oxidoreductase subunit K
MIGLREIYLVTGILFGLGLYTVATRKSAVAVLMGVELLLNAAALNFVAGQRYASGHIGGQIFALIIIVFAATEAAVALAIVLLAFRAGRTVDVEESASLRG